jgi:hypothetical protein
LADTSAQSRAKGASIDEFNALLRTVCPDEAKTLRIRLTELARSRGTTDEPTIDKIIESSLLLVQKIYSMDYAGEKPPYRAIPPAFLLSKGAVTPASTRPNAAVGGLFHSKPSCDVAYWHV